MKGDDEWFPIQSIRRLLRFVGLFSCSWISGETVSLCPPKERLL